MLFDLLHWLDADPLRFRAAAWGMLALVAVGALTPRLRPGWWRSPMLFGATMLLALAAFRWPTILFNRTMGNPDESQLVAGAMTMAFDPVPYRSVDVHTAGPLTPLAIVAVAKFLGLPVDFVPARLLGLMCAWVLVLAQWRTSRVVFGETTARVLAVPLLAVLGSAYHPEVTELITEPVPAALLAGGLWALAPLVAGTLPARWRMLFGGLLLGATPFAKLQAAPIGACLGFVALLLLWRQARPWRTAWRPAATLVAGSLIPLAVLGGVMLAAGTLGEFYTAYIGVNLGYVQAPHYPWIEGFGHAARMTRDLEPLIILFWAAVGVIVPALAMGWCFSPATRRLLWLALVFFAVAVLAAIAPGRAFPHYLYFLFGPAALLSGTFAGGCVQLAGTNRFWWWPRAARPVLWAAWIAGLVGPIVWLRIDDTPGPVGRLGQPDPEAQGLQTVIRDYVRPGDTLSVWGWMPHYYVLTGLRQATREAHTQHQIMPIATRDRSRARYLADLQHGPPAIFIDATGPGNFDFAVTSFFGHESFPALADWIGLHYLQVGVFNNGRVFARSDRVGEADPTAADLVGAFPAATVAPARWRGTKPCAQGPSEAAITMAHAPCTVFWRPFPREQTARFHFGIFPGAYTGDGTTDGVEFRVVALDHARGTRTVLFARHLRPLTQAADRGDQASDVRLPAGVTITFETAPGPEGNAAYDWAYWSGLRIESASP